MKVVSISRSKMFFVLPKDLGMVPVSRRRRLQSIASSVGCPLWDEIVDFNAVRVETTL